MKLTATIAPPISTNRTSAVSTGGQSDASALPHFQHCAQQRSHQRDHRATVARVLVARSVPGQDWPRHGGGSMAAPTTTEMPGGMKLLGILLWGAAVSVALGVYANDHTPTNEAPYHLFFTGTLQLKVWFATAVVALAVVQVLLGLRLYGRINVPREAPPWLGDAHRLDRDARVRDQPPGRLPVPVGARLPVDRHPRPRALDRRVLLLRHLRREGAGRARPGPSRLAHPRRRRTRLRRARHDLRHERVWFFTSRSAGIPLF